VSKTPLEKVMEFIKWLVDWKDRHGEDWTDDDFYVVGIYACYLADTAKEGAVHED